jgi:hypothetical protein
MAVTFDAGSEHDSGAVSSTTFSHTVANQANRVIYLLITAQSGGLDFANITSCTYNSVAMTVFFTATPNRRIRVYRLVAPSTGTNDFNVQWSGGNQEVRMVGISCYGVDQADPDDAQDETDAGGTSTSGATTSAVGDLVLDVLVAATGITGLAVDAGQTEINQSLGAFLDSVGTSYEAGAASVTMGWSWTGFSSFDHWRWNVNAAASGGGGLAWIRA